LPPGSEFAIKAIEHNTWADHNTSAFAGISVMAEILAARAVETLPFASTGLEWG
jgi:hypothetical protein